LADLHEQAARVYQEMWLFLGRASHQLKTPVTAMQTTLQVLLRKSRSKEELLSALSDLEKGMELLSVLTQGLIAASRAAYLPESKSDQVDLAAVFTDLSILYREKASAHEVSLRLPPLTPILVRGTVPLLHELFGNLVDNAIIYSGKCTSVQISCKVL